MRLSLPLLPALYRSACPLQRYAARIRPHNWRRQQVMRHFCIGPTCAASAFSEGVRSSPNCSRDKRIHALRVCAGSSRSLKENFDRELELPVERRRSLSWRRRGRDVVTQVLYLDYAGLNSVPRRSIACMMIASRRASAIRAFRMVERFAMTNAQSDEQTFPNESGSGLKLSSSATGLRAQAR